MDGRKLIDDAAEEADEEEEEEEHGGGEGTSAGGSVRRTNASDAKGKKKVIDDDDDNDDDDDDDDDDEEEDGDEDDGDEDEDDNIRKMDGFIVDEEEEESDGDDADDDDKKKKKKKKKRRRGPVTLDEEDYELIEEQTGMRVARPVKERRRIKKLKKDADNGAAPIDLEGIEDVDDDEDRDGKGNRDRADDDDLLDDGDDQFDEMYDFIDDSGEPGAKAARRRALDDDDDRNQGPSQRADVDLTDVGEDALNDAEGIFGGDFDANEMFAFESDGGEDDDDDIELEAGEGEAAVVDAKREKVLEKLSRTVEPAILHENFYTAKDEAIRQVDVPERLQKRLKALDTIRDDEAEAAWIVDTHFLSTSPYSNARDLLERGVREDAIETDDGIKRSMRPARNSSEARQQWYQVSQGKLRADIKKVLTLMHDGNLEICCIGERYKYECGELLALSEKEVEQFNSGKDFCRRWDVLWHVFDAEESWIDLNRKKAQAAELAKQTVLQLTATKAPEHSIERVQETEEILAGMTTIEEIRDLNAFIRVHSSRGANEKIESEGAYARGNTGSMYKRANKASKFRQFLGAWEEGKNEIKNFVDRIGLSPKQLGENLSLGYQQHDPQDADLDPTEMALEILRESGATNDDDIAFNGSFLRRSAIHVASVWFAVEPDIRKWARAKVQSIATVTTRPTRAGINVLDPFHMCGDVKALKNKPVHMFVDSPKFAKILHAREDGLLEFMIEVDEHDKSSLMEEFKAAFFTLGTSDVSEAWNSFRQSLLKASLDMMLPSLEREIEIKLRQESNECVKNIVKEAFWDRYSSAPFSLPTEDGLPFDKDLRVMSCVFGTGSPPTCFVMLDEDGEYIDFLLCPGLNGYRGAGPRGQPDHRDELKRRDEVRLQNFIMKHRPHVIALGTSNLACRQLLDDINEVVSKSLERNPHILDKGASTIHVVYVDEKASSIWAQSKVSDEEYHETSIEVRKGIALARTLLDPLAILCALFRTGEILSVRVHEYEEMLSEDTRKEIFQRALITLVNQTGVNLNDALRYKPWTFPKLSFVAGLGPRKAAQFKREVMRYRGYVTAKMDIYRGDSSIDMPPIMGPVVFENAHTALRITKDSLMRIHDETARYATDGAEWDPLDDTRVFARRWGLAEGVARVVLERCAIQIGESDAPIQKLYSSEDDARQIQDELQRITFEDLTSAGVEDPDGGAAWGIIAAKDLVDELRSPFAERRSPWSMPTYDKLLEYMSGETASSLRVGRLVQAKVRRLMKMPPFELKDVMMEKRPVARCELDSGLMAVVPVDLLSKSLENHLHEDSQTLLMLMEERLREGMVIDARVQAVDAKHFFVTLSTKSDELQDARKYEQRYCADPDKYYVVLTKQMKEQIMAGSTLKRSVIAPRKAKKKQFQDRPIDHPMFKNISHGDAEKMLEPRAIGSFVFRPSSKGNDHLSLTMKVYDDEYAHFDIKELGKEKGNAGKGSSANHLRLGEQLRIDREDFEDLDEIIYSFAEPIGKYHKLMKGHRKFAKGDTDAVDQLLRAKRATDNTMVAYALSANLNSPGRYFLSYIANSQRETPHHLSIRVSSKGYEFEKQIFRHVEKLTEYFKKNLMMIHSRGNYKDAAIKTATEKVTNESRSRPIVSQPKVEPLRKADQNIGAPAYAAPGNMVPPQQPPNGAHAYAAHANMMPPQQMQTGAQAYAARASMMPPQQAQTGAQAYAARANMMPPQQAQTGAQAYAARANMMPPQQAQTGAQAYAARGNMMPPPQMQTGAQAYAARGNMMPAQQPQRDGTYAPDTGYRRPPPRSG